MGYLDKQNRVIDVVLTERGRKLYATGDLDFTYFALFDDGLDYDPYSTGSLSEQERESLIEATPMLEATFVRDIRGTVAPGEPRSHVFTAAGGFSHIPRMSQPTSSSLNLMADQRKSGGVYGRTGTSHAQIDMKIVGDIEMGNPGFIVRVFASGSNGLQALDLRKDLSGRRAYDPFIAVSVDDEVPIDKPTVGNPSLSRLGDTSARRKR